ncbi:MAG: PadR family transcriptional regulator [Gemmatimonadota bacterium]|nr:MAG: PadR family transcriptional regulator [Gemmatimonadota bacterium]
MKRKKHLGELEQMVLMAVLQLKDDAYGTSVMNELSDRGGRRVSPGALFGTMDRLEAKGFVVSRLGDPTPGRGGKRKRYLTVTQKGLAALRDARSAWVRMSEGLEEVLQR